jgi:predicted transposase/invertase (TIGR01784 family)
LRSGCLRSGFGDPNWPSTVRKATRSHWLYLFKNSEKLKEEEMTALIEKEPDMKNAFHILEVYSADQEKRRLIEEKLRNDRDYQYDMAAQFEKGIEKGIEKGLAEGELIGEKKKAIETALLMSREMLDIHTIGRITGLSESELKELGIIKNKNFPGF